MVTRNELTEEQITNLMKSIPRAEEAYKLRAEIEKLRAALRWYADPRNHFPVEHRRPGDPDPAVVFMEEPPIMSDCGRRARKALADAYDRAKEVRDAFQQQAP
jgi:hypothetical protein